MEVKHLDFKLKDGWVIYNTPDFDNEQIVSFSSNGHIFFISKLKPGKTHERATSHNMIPLCEKNPSMNLEVKLYNFNNEEKVNTELFYIHPMKTGGSSIESAAFEYGVEWGWLYKWGTNKGFNPHSPSFHFMGLDYLKDKVFFTSVRNPYDRIVSSFYNIMSSSKYIEYIKTKDDFNNKIRELIHHTYLEAGLGMVPCYDFVYLNDKKIIPHVIRMEDGLNEEFNKLMFEYNCPIRLDKHVNKGSTFHKEKRWGVDDINPGNISMINKRYEKDFEYFGYAMK